MHLNSFNSPGGKRVKLALNMKSARAYMIWVFGGSLERKQGKNIVPALVPADQGASGAQGNN